MGNVREDVIGLTQTLVRIPSENGIVPERACAEFVANWLDDLGVEIQIAESAPGRPNVVARLPGRSGPPLVFMGHLDTVPVGSGWTVDPFGAQIVDGRLYGRGAADMKGGLAAVLVAFRRIVNAGRAPARDLLVVATADEEGPGMLGALHFQQTWSIGPDALLLATEPSSLRAALVHRGVMWYQLVVHGRMSHAGRAELGLDAIHGAALAVAAIKRAVDDLPHRHPLLGRPLVTATQIEAGVARNIVPDRCTLALDLRLIPPMTTAWAREFVQSEVEAAIAALPGLHVEVSELSIDRPPVESDESSPLVRALDGAYRDATGAALGRAGNVAYTDPAIIQARTGGRHAVIFGPGSFDQAHSADEWAPVGEIVTCADVLTRTAERLLA